MERLATKAKANGISTPYTYGATPNDNLRWDYRSVMGCLCNEGYSGPDCTLRTCPAGDDPYTRDQDNAKQYVKCVDSGTTSQGTFKLKFRDQKTAAISYNANQATVETALEALSSFIDVGVTYSSGNVACTAAGTNVIAIEFLTEHGGNTQFMDLFHRTYAPAVPSMSAEDVTDLTVTVSGTSGSLSDGTTTHTAVAGSKEYNLCSDRGLCIESTGMCSCFQGMGSSNGQGASGQLNDCGHIEPYQVLSSSS